MVCFYALKKSKILVFTSLILPKQVSEVKLICSGTFIPDSVFFVIV